MFYLLTSLHFPTLKELIMLSALSVIDTRYYMWNMCVLTKALNGGMVLLTFSNSAVELMENAGYIYFLNN